MSSINHARKLICSCNDNSPQIARRGFLAAGVGGALLSASTSATASTPLNDRVPTVAHPVKSRLPREVTIATISQSDLKTDSGTSLQHRGYHLLGCTWPFVNRFSEIHAKYGAAIRITTHPEEEWSIIESRSPDVKVADVLQEFELESIDDYLVACEAKQARAR